MNSNHYSHEGKIRDNTHRIMQVRQLYKLRWLLLASLSLLFSGMVGTDTVLSQDPNTGGQGAAGQLDESTLPILFEEDFEDSVLDLDTWAYDIRDVELLFEDAEETNQVAQFGHDINWAEAVLLRGDEWHNYIVEVDVKLLRYVDGADNFFLGVRYSAELGEYAVSLDLARRLVNLSSTAEGIWQGVAAEVPLVLDLNTWYRLKVHVQDASIYFFVNDELTAQINDSTLTEGSIRLLAAPGSLVQVDNVLVREIPSPAEEGDLLITEFMFRGNAPQWFELYNDSGRNIKLTDLHVTNGADVQQIQVDPLLIPPHSYMLFMPSENNLVRTPDIPVYYYGDALRFPQDNGYLALSMDGEIVTEIAYSEDTGWPLQDNVSVALHPDYLTRRRQNNGYSWCPSVQKLPGSEAIRATPGRRNHICVRELPLGEEEVRQSGELLITEIMVALRGPDQGREWIEVYNPGDTEVSMAGMTLTTDKPNEEHTITGALVVPPRGYVVLAQAGLEESHLPAGISIYYYPGNFKVTNEDGELTIVNGERVLDTVSYRESDWWPIRAGMSMTLHPDAYTAYSNDDALNWCLAWSRIETIPDELGTPGAPNDACPMWEINSPITDDPRAYEQATFEAITMYVTISGDDFTDMHANPFSDTVYPIQFAVDGYPEYAEVSPNATIRPRGGRGTRSAAMLSYRIRLDTTVEPFWGHRTLRLSKHLGDPTRLRNNLAFRLFSEMENMVSLRTQFVRLFINGEDQGVYTMIESTGSRFLRNHHLDDRGHLFKVVLPSGSSSFMYYGDTDRTGRLDSIRITAQIEVGRDHNGLIEMIDALYSDMDIHEVIDRHFNKDNLLTHFALVYLLQNRDTRVQNYMLYTTPREPSRVYFVPWDWDSAFRVRATSNVFVGRWREGFGNWAGMGIIDRMLREPDLVDELVFKMVELAQTSLSPERIDQLVDDLVAAMEPFTRRAPEHFEMTPQQLAEDAAAIKQVFSDSATMLIESIEWPMPPRAHEVVYDETTNSVEFVWSESFDMQGDPVEYEIVLFNERLWNEENIVWRTERTTHTSITISAEDIPNEVPAGTYYWMVYVWDDKNHYNTSGLGSLGDIEMIVDLP